MIPITKNKVFICGMHEKTLREQDWDDRSVERWGLAHHRLRWHYYDRLFESHCPEIVKKYCPYHLDRLREYAQSRPVYSPWEWPEGTGIITISHDIIFESLEYPSPRRFWESSISFPMALAMTSDVEEIGIYGVDMSDAEEKGERTHQKHSVLYQIGLAEGMGIKVTIPNNCTLFDSGWTGGIYGNPEAVDDIHYQLG